jgi:cyclophilin family peptidyl-prolyl cis-trans isomerase
MTLLMIILFMGSTLVTIGSMFMGNRNAKTIVVMETTKGTIEIELDSKNAEVTVLNFIGYVKDGFYDGTVFHRVIPGFMIQGGGFTQDGTEKPTNDPIELESDNGLKNVRGAIAMARTSVPDSATSQFFINLVDNEFLDHRPGNDGYAVFGSVVKGMDVVDAIAGVRTGPRGSFEDWPLDDIVITKAHLKK